MLDDTHPGAGDDTGPSAGVITGQVPDDRSRDGRRRAASASRRLVPVPATSRHRRSGIEIRNQPALDPCDEVLELQLALLQASEPELIEIGPLLHARDSLVEVAMLDLECFELLDEHTLFVGHAIRLPEPP